MSLMPTIEGCKAARTFTGLCGSLWLLAVLSVNSVFAQSVADFYKGGRIEYLVGSGAGGGYDLYARSLSRHMGKHLPGNPTIVIKNLPGGGGIRASNLMYNVSPRDGSVIGTVSRAMITTPLTGQQAAKFNASKFTWIGSVNKEDSFCISWKTAKVKTWTQLQDQALVVGTPAQGSSAYTWPVMLRNLFGAKFELIAGYPDATSISLAMERGEVDAVCPSITAIEATHPEWIKNGSINPIVVIGLKRAASLPNVPSVIDLASTDEQRQILKLILGPQFAGRPVLGPPEIPADRVTALRNAFDATVADPVYLGDMQKSGLEVNAATGNEVETLVNDIYAAPKSMIERMQQVTVKPSDMKESIRVSPVEKVNATLSSVEDGGRAIVLDVEGKSSKATLSGSRTKIVVKGKDATRAALAPGMKCLVTYQGDNTEAKDVQCD